MKRLINYPMTMVLLTCTLLAACGDDDDNGNPAVEPVTFEVTVENINPGYSYAQAGIFNTPDGDDSPGPVLPGSGDTYSFSFEAGSNYLPGETPRLTAFTMLVASNDLFLAPSENGIPLYDESGVALNGDITNEFYLWDAGTEVNRAPGSMDQPGPNNEPAGSGTDENGVVMLLGGSDGPVEVNIETNSGTESFAYPPVNELFRVSISNEGTMFTVTIENLSAMSNVPSPISPGGYVIHTGDEILFSDGEAERGNGIEEVAEDGITGTFEEHISSNTGLIVPLSPGVWAVHENGTMPLFEDGMMDYGNGLEAIAEDGNPANLANALPSVAGVISSGSFGSGPIGPGGSYQFTFEAVPGNQLSWATMFVQSNDWIYSFEEGGVQLFSGMTPASGDVTGLLRLYDVGTEIDQYPGAGMDQAIRQSGPDTGADDPDNSVREITSTYNIVPPVSETIRVTLRVLN